MATGSDLITEALKHIGETYILGADVPFDDPNYKGPWDCAEFASWVVYKVSGIIIGCVDNEASIKKLEPYSGGWYKDASTSTSKISIAAAKSVRGCVVVRKPVEGVVGHVAFSDGEGGTVEAMSSARDVTKDKIDGRKWHVAFKIPGITY